MTQRERRLGRGLDSLIGGRGGCASRGRARPTVSWRRSHSTYWTQIPGNLGPTFPAAELEELIRSIEKHGVLQPIVVRRAGTRYQIVAGERRWRASQELGTGTIDAVVIEAHDRDMLEWSIVENAQRSDLNPIDLAVALKRLIDEFHLTQEEVGERVGQSRSHVANTLRLLDLPAEIRAMVSRGTVSAGAGRALFSIRSQPDRLRLAKEVEEGKLTVRQLEAQGSWLEPRHHRCSRQEGRPEPRRGRGRDSGGARPAGSDHRHPSPWCRDRLVPHAFGACADPQAPRRRGRAIRGQGRRRSRLALGLAGSERSGRSAADGWSASRTTTSVATRPARSRRPSTRDSRHPSSPVRSQASSPASTRASGPRASSSSGGNGRSGGLATEPSTAIRLDPNEVLRPGRVTFGRGSVDDRVDHRKASVSVTWANTVSCAPSGSSAKTLKREGLSPPVV